MKEKATQVEDAIRRLQAERGQLQLEPDAGLAPDAIQTIEGFVAEVAHGIDLADRADRRRIYDVLRLKGTVRIDNEHGVKLGRRHHFNIRWAGAIAIPNSGQDLKKTRLRFYTSDYGEWEAKYLGETPTTRELGSAHEAILPEA